MKARAPHCIALLAVVFSIFHPVSSVIAATSTACTVATSGIGAGANGNYFVESGGTGIRRIKFVKPNEECDWTVPQDVTEITVIIVGGGGSGGLGNQGGGGGAGEVLYKSSLSVTSATDIDVRVGAGGAAAQGSCTVGNTNYCPGQQGGNTTITIDGVSITALGGGGGGGSDLSNTSDVTQHYKQRGKTGGSSGGGNRFATSATGATRSTYSGWTSYANNGAAGASSSEWYGGGGGGGAGGEGTSAYKAPNSGTQNPTAGTGGSPVVLHGLCLAGGGSSVAKYVVNDWRGSWDTTITTNGPTQPSCGYTGGGTNQNGTDETGSGGGVSAGDYYRTGGSGVVYILYNYPLKPTVDLASGSDSGSSSTDNITNVTQPTISIPNISSGGSAVVTATKNTSTLTCSISAGNSSCNLPTLSDGTWSITATQTVSGATSVTSSPLSISIDTVGPATSPTISSWPSNGNSRSATFSFSGEANATFICKLETTDYEACTSPKTFESIPDGSNTFIVLQKDVAGNISTGSQKTWTIDATPPSAPTIVAAPTSGNSKSGFAEFTYDGANTSECKLNSGSYASCSGGKYYYNNLPDGSYVLRVRETDSYGNIGPDLTINWIIDSTKPDTPVITSSAITNSRAPIISGSAEVGTEVTITVNGATFLSDGNDGKTASDGLWRLDLATANPVSGDPNLNLNGTNSISVIATDDYGNTSSSATQTLTIDTTAPGSPVFTSGSSTTSSRPTIAGTAAKGTTVSVVIGGATYTAAGTAGNWSVNLETATPTSGTLSLNLSGTNSVIATATDLAGNVSTQATQTLTINAINSIVYNNQSATTAQSGGSATYISGSAISTIPTTAPTKTGYTFAGWYTALSGGSQVTNGSYTPASPYGTITLYAIWSANALTVTYNFNGATGGNSTSSASYNPGGTALTLPTPTKTGYTFAGWYSDSLLTTSIGSGGSSYSPEISLTIYAKWTGNSIEIGLDARGGTGGGKINTNVGSSISEPSAPSRSGYTFSGWATSFNGTPIAFNPTYTITQTTDFNLYAIWVSNTLTVTLDYQDGRSTTTTTVLTGASMSAPTSPTRSSYAFSGWATSSAGSPVSFPFAHSETSDFTLYAIWSSDSSLFTVSFRSEGGIGTMVDQTSNTTTNLTINSYTRTGYSFSGWSTEPNNKGIPYADGASYSFTSDLTLYATWSLSGYYVSFETQGGTSVDTQLLDAGASIALPTQPTRSGYSFSGWSLTSAGPLLTFPYTPGSSSSITLYAIWNANSIVITFDSNGGSSVSSVNSSIGGSISEPTAPTKAGNVFLGWATKVGDPVVTFPYLHGAMSSFTLYANWQNGYKITFNSQSGSYVPFVIIAIGESATAPTAPTRSNYTFSGWWTSSSGGLQINFPYAPSGNETLYARWIQDEVEVSITLRLTSGTSSAAYRTQSTIEALVTVTGRVTFYQAGKPIASCSRRVTIGTAPSLKSTCSWKPSTRGYVRITAIIFPNDRDLQNKKSTVFNVFVSNRTTRR